ncbi:hypothetical protein GGS24DRAFT_497249 [Hypoxylon argillaceum]|nr:hypothetical protein GGS24DRAFT_497249 [Hypoxylon argillaceum]KAI1156444.1 hypothetical protein F4825DRAFT_446636 [Nemania diffusa]
MTPLYLCASSMSAVAAAAATAAAQDTSTSSMSSAHISDSNTRRPSNVTLHPPPKPKKKKTHSTDPYLRDFTLVAEAARRAQISLMTRDMESAFPGPERLTRTNKRNARFDWGCLVPSTAAAFITHYACIQWHHVPVGRVQAKKPISNT